jgi:hypothetical protein
MKTNASTYHVTAPFQAVALLHQQKCCPTISAENTGSQIKFSYGDSFIVSLKFNDETIVLQAKNDGKLFILNNSTLLLGNAVNICCLGPNSSEPEYRYDILVAVFCEGCPAC